MMLYLARHRLEPRADLPIPAIQAQCSYRRLIRWLGRAVDSLRLFIEVQKCK
jgi:hypothetical protein